MRMLQIGADWPSERAGGIASYYGSLLANLDLTEASVDGLVLGSDEVRRLTRGKVVAFAGANERLPNRMLALRREALRCLSEKKIDLIASHFAIYAFPIVDRLSKTPHVVHFHGPWAAESDVEGSSRFRRWIKTSLEHSVYSRARRLIVLSEAFRHELITRYGVNPTLIRVIPGGVDIRRFNTQLTREQAREQLGWPRDRHIVLSVRRQVRRMGLEALIDAAQLMRAQVPDILLLLGGSGPLGAELDQRISERGLTDHVRRLGSISDGDLPLAYRAANMTVVPSQAFEGFGLITLESLASGTPSYVTPTGGLPELIRPFSPECVFAGTSAKDIAAGLIQALTGEHSIPTDEACRAYAANNFPWNSIANHVLNVYKEALS